MHLHKAFVNLRESHKALFAHAATCTSDSIADAIAHHQVDHSWRMAVNAFSKSLMVIL